MGVKGEVEIKNAVIKSAAITNDEHGLLTAWLQLDFGGTGQGFGGYGLYLPKDFKHHDPGGPNYAGHFIWRVMEVAGVSEWGQLVGKTIRVKAAWSNVQAIGHIIKEDWFNPELDFDAMKSPRVSKLEAVAAELLILKEEGFLHDLPTLKEEGIEVDLNDRFKPLLDSLSNLIGEG